jgi:type I restriction enzyme, S subunit
MREGWVHSELDPHIDLLTGHPFKSSDYCSDEGGLLLLRGDNVIHGAIRWDDAKRWPTDKANGLARYVLREGDIVIALDRTWVKSGLKAAVISASDIPSMLVQRVARIRAKPTLDQNFLAVIVQSHRFIEMARTAKTETAVPHISPNDVRDFVVYLPPLHEQGKIADILRTWDEAIEKLTTLRKANLSRRIWMRSHLFTGRTRLPGHAGKWREVALREVLTEHGLQGTGAEEVFSVSVHKGLINQIEHLGRSFAAADTGHYNRVLPGDIVYTKSPTGEFPLGIIKQSKIAQEVIVSPLYGVFTPATHALGVILDALFESPIAVRNYLHPLVQKGAKNTIAITNRRFLEGKLRLPMDPAEQAAIAEVAITTQAELACIDAEIDALTRQKRGLMQKLLTGEWRVTVDPTTPSNPAGETQDGR